MAETTTKAAVREEARARRRQLEDRAARSRQIHQTLIDSDEFHSARRLLLYVAMSDEVQTDETIHAVLEASEKELFVPYCDGDDLRLFRLLDLSELEPGAYTILEPKPEFRSLQERHGQIEQMDLVIVPGVAFDRAGNRVGQGAGYYDRLLGPVAQRPFGERPTLIGLAFECQMFDAVPHGSHDIKMDRVITA